MRGSESGQKQGKKDIAVFDDITFEKQAEGERSVRFLLGRGGQACQGSGEEDGGGEEGGGGGGGVGGGGGKDKRFLSRSRSLPATARQVCQIDMSLVQIYLLCSYHLHVLSQGI